MQAIEKVINEAEELPSVSNEFKEMEAKLLRTKQLYAFISQVNQKIVRIKDETLLFSNACSMAVEFGKFKIAWIGLVNDERTTITLVEQAGMKEDELVRFVNVPKKISEVQNGVINTGDYYLCNDIDKNNEPEAEKLYTDEQEICCYVVLPIRKSGKIIGTFNLYAADKEVTQKEETKLLIEVAKDISFALDLFEKEKRHKIAEKQIEKSAAFNNGVLRALKSHIAVINSNGEIVSANEACKNFSIENGVTDLQNTCEGSNYFEVCERSAKQGEKLATKALKGIKEVMNDTTSSFNMEYPSHSPTEERWFNMQAMKFVSDESMCVVVHKNIIYIKVVEVERSKITDDLIKRNNDLEQFTYIISHNLRSPVANILGIVNALNAMKTSSEKEMQLFGFLSTAALKLDEVIKDLNQILKIRDSIIEQEEVVNFNEMLDNVKQSLESVLFDKISFKPNFSSVKEMFTLKSYLHSIFLNLISNSIKYRQSDIKLLIEITSKRVGNTIELIFKDNGLGIDLEKNGNNIFGLYKRFHLNIEGKGMGLFMVKAQVERLGGTISIKSKVNTGTEFKIIFQQGVSKN